MLFFSNLFFSVQRSSLSYARLIALSTLTLFFFSSVPLGGLSQANGQPVVSPAVPRVVTPKAAGKKTPFSWDVIYFQGKRIGYRQYKTELQNLNGQPFLVSESNERMKFKRFGQVMLLETKHKLFETQQGVLLSLSLDIKDNKNTTTRINGIVDGRHFSMETKNGGRAQKKQIPWNANMISSSALDRKIEKHDWQKQGQLIKQVIIPELSAVGTITVTAMGKFETNWWDGTKRKLQMLRSKNSAMPAIVTSIYLDANGKIIKTSAPVLGGKMESFRVTRDKAMETLKDDLLDLAAGTQIRLQNRLKKGLRTESATYQLISNETDLSNIILESEGQLVKKLKNNALQITLKRVPFPKAGTLLDQPYQTQLGGGNKNAKKKNQAIYLKPTPLIDAEDIRVIRHAKQARGNLVQPVDIATKMEQYVFKNIRKKNFSTALATASQVAKTLEGDCTEHAVLLAAMLRSQKIPARVVAGFVYIEANQAFGGHMWTEVWLGGKWIPLDATLGQKGIGGTHLKLSHSTIEEEGATASALFLPIMALTGKIEMSVLKQK